MEFCRINFSSLAPSLFMFKRLLVCLEKLERFMNAIIRGLKSRLSRFQNPAYDSPEFWANRQKRELNRFRFKRFFLLRKRNLIEGKSNRIALFSTYKRAWLWPTLIATFVVIIIYLESVLPFISPFPSDKKDAFMNLTMGIAAVGGLLIGLYYSALITAAGTVYASVPTPLRMRLVRERTGATYMWFVATVTVAALSASLFHILFDMQSRFITFVLLFGGALSVFAFVSLGKQAFALFNPSNLLRPAYKHLVEIVQEHVEQPGLYSGGAFQQNARQRVYNELGVIETVRDLALTSPSVRSSDLTSVVRNASWVLENYHALKPSITLNSLWYERQYEHASWHGRSNLTSDISIRTATHLQAEEVIDYHWFEKRLLKLSSECLKGNSDLINIEIATTAVSSLGQMVSSIVKAHDLAFALEVSKEVIDDICNILTAQTSSNAFSTEHRNQLQLISAIERLIVQILLDSSAVLSSYNEQNLAAHATAIELGKAHSSAWNLPLETARRLAPFFSTIDLERKSEGKTISANWYIREKIRLELLRSLKEDYETLFTKLFEFYEGLYQATEDQWGKAIIISGQAEFYFKVDYHFDQMRNAFDELETNRVIEDPMWPKVEFDKCRQDIVRSKRQHTIRLGELAVRMAVEPQTNDLPDFGGQFLALLQEDVFNAVLKRDQNVLEKVLPNYTASVLLAVRNGYESDLPLTDPRAPSIALHAFAELMDLVEVFGLTKIVSEFHNDADLWQLFATQWDKTVKAMDDNFLARIASLNSLANTGMQSEAHYDLRFRWRRSIEILLETAPVERRMPAYRGRAIPIEEVVPTHSSPLIRALTPQGRMGLSDVNGIAVMMIEVIRGNLPNDGAQLAYNERNLVNRLERVSR